MFTDTTLDLSTLSYSVFLLLVPVHDFFNHVLQMNVRNVIVLSQLLSIERFPSSWGSSDENLNGLESSLLAELLFDNLNAGS